MRVRVPEVWMSVKVPATEVELEAFSGTKWAVRWQGKTIGYVWKGTRRYSPPIHRGSRIVRYHKQVPEWHGHATDPFATRRTAHTGDTRQRVLQRLLQDALS